MVGRFALGALTTVMALAISGCGASEPEVALSTPVPVETQFYLNPSSALASVADEDPRFTSLAQQPTPLWLTEWAPVDEVESIVTQYVEAAFETATVPVLVLYRIPERDCGRSQDGALSTSSYRKWIGNIADGISAAKGAADQQAWVILEPDAVAMSDECGGDKRLKLIAETAERLDEADAEVYLDGGHSGWHSAKDQADLLIKAGIVNVRGFATNVANQKQVDDERHYAEEILDALAQRGATNKHYVVDTSRAGAEVGGSACNSFDARLGPNPQIVEDPSLDAYLWVKTPGFPDGLCNGAPDSTSFWPKLALSLMGES